MIHDEQAVHVHVHAALSLPELIGPLALYRAVAVLNCDEREIRIRMGREIDIGAADGDAVQNAVTVL